jgi:hypothetical protein
MIIQTVITIHQETLSFLFLLYFGRRSKNIFLLNILIYILFLIKWSLIYKNKE